MLKSKYGNEVAFVMDSIVASYGGKLEKKAQALQKNAQMDFLSSEEERDTGGPVPLGRTLSDTIDTEVGDPESEGKDPSILNPGAYTSLWEQEDKRYADEDAKEDERSALNRTLNNLETEYNEDRAGGASYPEAVTLDETLLDGAPLEENPYKEPSLGLRPLDFESPRVPSPSNIGGATPATAGEPVDAGPAGAESFPYGPTQASSVLNAIEKIATHLGNKGDFRSEMLADELLKSVINDLSKK